LMSVLPPSSAKEAGIPATMLELMNQPFSPLIDFYPVDFGLDLNGKRFTWQAVILLPFIDEPRLVRILAPLLKRLTANEKIRNRRGQELVFGHKDDKKLFHAIQLAQAAFEAGNTGMRQAIRGESYCFCNLEGFAKGGGKREVVSPIEGLPDVEESDCVAAQFYEPENVPHFSKLLPGINEQALVINAGDMDDRTRMKGFGGEPAKRMILQALGKNPDEKPKYKNPVSNQVKLQEPVQAAVPPVQARRAAAPVQVKPAKPAAAQPAAEPMMAAPVMAEAAADQSMFDYEEDESEFGAPAPAPVPAAPPAGAKVIRVRAAERQPAAANKGGGRGAGSRAAPY